MRFVMHESSISLKNTNLIILLRCSIYKSTFFIQTRRATKLWIFSKNLYFSGIFLDKSLKSLMGYRITVHAGCENEFKHRIKKILATSVCIKKNLEWLFTNNFFF
jgi:hypothetical protein